MNNAEQVSKYMEYCEYGKGLDGNTLKAYRIDLRQFLEEMGLNAVNAVRGKVILQPQGKEFFT